MATIVKQKTATSKDHKTIKLRKQWKEVVSAYRWRHYLWIQAVLPTMSDREWKEYEQWVADFGGSQQRKLKRRLSGGRRPTEVTATVTSGEKFVEYIHQTHQKLQDSNARTSVTLIDYKHSPVVVRMDKHAPPGRRVTMTYVGATRRT